MESVTSGQGGNPAHVRKPPWKPKGSWKTGWGWKLGQFQESDRGGCSALPLPPGRRQAVPEWHLLTMNSDLVSGTQGGGAGNPDSEPGVQHRGPWDGRLGWPVL